MILKGDAFHADLEVFIDNQNDWSSTSNMTTWMRP